MKWKFCFILIKQINAEKKVFRKDRQFIEIAALEETSLLTSYKISTPGFQG